jgi:hypothetical protein
MINPFASQFELDFSEHGIRIFQLNMIKTDKFNPGMAV